MRRVQWAAVGVGIWVLAGSAALALSPSPTDLGWLRGEVGDGALVYMTGSNIKLTELSDGKTVNIGTGLQPEFSPDSSKIAWIDGSTAKGRMRKGNTTIHTIATGVSPVGVHWISNDEVVVLKSNKWYRVKIDGSSEVEVPQLTALGSGGTETDVKLGSDGVWSWVSGKTWKTSDGGSGSTGGECSSSLSPDGKSVTGLHHDHKSASLTRIRSGGTSGTLRWAWDYSGSKGFDNQRWSSNDGRFVVCQDEKYNYLFVQKVGGTYGTRMGQSGSGEMYGDFTVGDGAGASWPTGGTANQAPNVTISQPSAGASVQEGDAIAYSGSASDPEDGALSGAALVWEYDISGDGEPRQALGTGASGTFAAPAHPSNSYPYTLTIYLQATDSQGLSSEASVALTVNGTGGSQTPAVTLISPNGGEVWTAGSTQQIRWSTVAITDVKILYSTDGGLTWQIVSTTVDISHPWWGDFPWQVPSEFSTQALILVQDYDGVVASAQSAGTFEIISGGGTDVDPPVISVIALGIAGTVNDLSISTVTIEGIGFPVTDGTFDGEGLIAASPATLTVSASDVLGNSVTRTLQVAVGTAGGSTPTLVTIEAEDMTLTSGYVVQDYYITANNTGAIATTSFAGTTGTYSLKVHILAENDGQPTVEVYVGTALVGTINYPLGTAARDPQTIDLGQVSFTAGDEIKLVGTPDAGALARVDKVVLEP